jgi:hypothetical protein
MTSFTAALPATSSRPPGSVHFVRTGPGRGVVTIRQPRCRCRYVIREFAADRGRAFHFAKCDPGSDRTVDRYDVFVADPHSGEFDLCSCKGAERFGRCKHLAAARAVAAGGWLADSVPADRRAPATQQPGAPRAPDAPRAPVPARAGCRLPAESPPSDDCGTANVTASQPSPCPPAGAGQRSAAPQPAGSQPEEIAP